MIDKLSDEDLATWGYPREEVFEPLERTTGSAPQKRVVNRYTLQRRIFLALRKNIHSRPHGALLQRVRYYCDVLLRD